MTRETAMSAAESRCREEARAAAARPLTIYRVFWLFLIAGFAGDLIEVVFWLITRGELISRSSLIYGPFSLVWGLGAVLLTLAFHRMDDRGRRASSWRARCWAAPMNTYAPGCRRCCLEPVSGITAICPLI